LINSGSRKLYTALLLASIAVLAVSSWALITSYRVNATTVETHYIYRIGYSVRLTYEAKVTPSILYGNNTVVKEGTPLYIKLLKGINVSLRYTFTPSAQDANITLRASPALMLKGAGWSKTIPYGKVYTLRLANGGSAGLKINIDFSRSLKLIRSIESEIGVRGTNHTIVLYVPTKVRIRIAGINTSRELTPSLMLKLGGDGRVYVSKTQGSGVIADAYSVVKHNKISLAGLSLPVRLVRTTSTFATIASALMATACLIVLQKGRKSRKDPLESFKGKIIKGELTHRSSPQIRLLSLKELIDLANARGKDLIIAENGKSRKYYIVDIDAIYYYEQSGGGEDTGNRGNSNRDTRLSKDG